MDIEKQYFHFFNDIKIFLQYYYQVRTIDDAYKWCLDSINTMPLYTVIRVLNTSVVYFRQLVDNIDTEIFSNRFHELMIQIMTKFYNTTNVSINKQNIINVSSQIMSIHQHDTPLQLKTIKRPMKFKINVGNSQFVYQVLTAFKLKYLL